MGGPVRTGTDGLEGNHYVSAYVACYFFWLACDLWLLL